VDAEAVSPSTLLDNRCATLYGTADSAVQPEDYLCSSL
jgi:hypothetical protein